nr:hypothetical transcript [Hymenolepis microstoma]
MCRSTILRLLCLIFSLFFNVKLCYLSFIPLSLSRVTTDPFDLDLHARLLSDEIDCDFNNGSFCQLHNNGGWTFQQSLLEHSQLNLPSTNNASYPTLSKPNHYICADWGGTKGNTSSEESTRSAELQAFISLPSPRQDHLKGGNVFYLGEGPVCPSSSLYSLSPRQSSYHLKPPTDQWLHFTMPLDIQFFHPESPLPFALYGYNGMCIDSIHVERCATTVVSSLSWPPNNTLYLALSLPPSTILSSTTKYFNHPIFTGAFLFIVLLVVLLVLLILICVISIIYGRKRSNKVVKKRGKIEQKKVPLVIPSLDLMHSPSVSSLPAAVVHQRQIEEISYSVNDEFKETLNDTGCSDDNHRRHKGDLRHPHKRHPRRLQSVVGDEDAHYSRSQRLHREISAQFPSSSSGRRDKRQSTAPLLSLQPFNWRRSTVSKSDAVDQINSRSGFQRFSLLLSVNENNELVLISPETTNGSSNEKLTQKKNDASDSFVMAKDSAIGSDETSRSSCSTSTSYTTTTTTTPAGTCRPLSSLEAEATLQEMAASVSQLGREFVRKRNVEDDNETGSSSSIVESSESSIACLSHNLRLPEQKSLDRS